MTPFEQMWETSRTNAFSGQTAMVNLIAIMLLLLVAFLPDRVYLVRWVINVAVVLGAAWISTEYASQEIDEKWRIRYEYADAHRTELTDDERLAVTVDGANRLLGPLMFGALATFRNCGIALLAIVGLRYLITFLRGKNKTLNDVSDRIRSGGSIDT